MKRLTLLLTALLTAVFVSACGSRAADEETTSAADPGGNGSVKIAVSDLNDSSQADSEETLTSSELAALESAWDTISAEIEMSSEPQKPSSAGTEGTDSASGKTDSSSDKSDNSSSKENPPASSVPEWFPGDY